MKKQLPIIFIFFLFIFTNSFSQSFSPDISNVDTFIMDVYADKAQVLGYTTSAGKERFVNVLKRVRIVERNSSHPQNMISLSQIPLISNYNPELKRDDPFNPATFNPFKYKLDTVRKDRSVFYLVEGTNYVIEILPI